jgi:hypothetical protein
MSEEGFFPNIYRRFLERRNEGHGHDFEEVPIISEVPPTVTFKEKLRWWSFDRWKRRQKIRAERDRRLQEILHP